MNCQKHLFNLRPDIHYLNCAYKSPLLASAKSACLTALERESNPVDISIDDFFKETELIKSAFGQLIHSKAQDIAIIPSVSYGFATAFQNIKAKKNGHAIIIKDAFPSGYFTLQKWCKAQQHELKIIGPDAQKDIAKNWNEKILTAINQQTSVVVLAAVHWMNGLVFDLKAIGEKCKSVDAVLIVDGTQSVGALPIDVQAYQIDALICGTYKWMYGAYGLGVAYYGDYFQDGVPIEESWMNRRNAKQFSSLSDYETAYTDGAGRYSVGQTSHFVLSPIVRTGLEQLIQWQPKRITQYARKLKQPLIDYCEQRGFSDRDYQNSFSDHLFPLPLPANTPVEKLKENLVNNKVFVSFRGDFIRTSISVFNDENDIAQLMATIQATLKI